MSLITIAKHAAVAIAILLGVLILWQIGVAVAIFLSALAIGAAILPLVEAMRRSGWPRSLAIISTITACLGVVVTLLAVICLPIAEDVNQLGNDITNSFVALEAAAPEHWLVQLVGTQRQPVVEDERTTLPAWQRLVVTAVGTAAQIIEFFAQIILCLAISLYWTLDRERLERLWLSLLPVRQRTGTHELVRSVEREVGAYLRSEFVQGVVAMLLLWIGFEVLGLRYAALLATLAALCSLIPWVGTMLATVAVFLLASPAILKPLGPLVSLQGWLAVVYMVAILCFLEFIVEPRLFRRDRYNSLLTALATIAMTLAFGLWGLLFGPLVGYVVQIVARLIYPRLIRPSATPTTLTAICQRLEQLQQRVGSESDAPPEVLSLLQRLDKLVESQRLATASDSSAPATGSSL